MRLFVIALALLAAIPAWAANIDDKLIVKKSPHSVAATVDRLAEALKKRGIGIAARVDHAAAAERVGEKLPPTQLLIFGNPKLGTPLMQANRKAGLELPMKVLAWADDSGQVWLAYAKPAILKAEYAISGRDNVFAAMEQALDTLTNEAVKDK